MSYGYKKASKKDEEDMKEYTAAAAEETPKADSKGLEKVLTKQGIDYATFARSDESYRKRVLKDDYQETKTKYGWQYDQPIE